MLRQWLDTRLIVYICLGAPQWSYLHVPHKYCKVHSWSVAFLLSPRLQSFLFRRHLRRPFNIPKAISTTVVVVIHVLFRGQSAVSKKQLHEPVLHGEGGVTNKVMSSIATRDGHLFCPSNCLSFKIFHKCDSQRTPASCTLPGMPTHKSQKCTLPFTTACRTTECHPLQV